MIRQTKCVLLTAVLRLGFILIFVTPAVSALRTFFFVRRYGRYDPFQIKNGPQHILVGVNDCPEDESKDLITHIWKGDYRNPILDNITDYNVTDAQMVLINKQGDQILKLTECNFANDVDQFYCQNDESKKVQIKKLDEQGGLLATVNGKTVFMIFNPRHYTSDSSEFNGQALLISLNDQVAIYPTGYKGCKFLPASLSPMANESMSINVCQDKCSSYEGFGIQTDKCYCDNGFAERSGTGEENCRYLCSKDVNHLCGRNGSYAVYDKSQLQTFLRAVSSSQSNTNLIMTMTYENTSQMASFDQVTYLSSVTITEDEECTLTNVYFNFTEPYQLPRYRLLYTMNCSENESQWNEFDDELWGNHQFLKAGDKAIDLGLLKVRCLKIEANDTERVYSIANITFTGPSGQFAEVAGIAFQANYAPKEEESISPSASSSEIDIMSSESISMEITTIPDIISSESVSMEMTTIPDVTWSESLSMKMTTIPDDVISSETVAVETTVDVISSYASSKSSDVISSYASSKSSDVISSYASSKSSDVISSYASSKSSDVMPTPSASVIEGTTVTERSASLTEGDISTSHVTTSPATGPADTPTTPTRTQTCMCRCKTDDPTAGENKTLDEVTKEKTEKIQKELQVDKKELSATKMKKESAPDVRTSAQVTGYVGIILLTIVAAMLLLADITSIFQHVSMLKSNIKQSFKSD